MPILLSDLVAADRQYTVGPPDDPVVFTLAPAVYPVERAVSATAGDGGAAEPDPFERERAYAETLAKSLDTWIEAYGKSWSGVVDDAGEPVPLTLDVFRLWRDAFWREAEDLFWQIYRDRERLGKAGNPSGRSPNGGSAKGRNGVPSARASNQRSRASGTAASAPAPKMKTGRKTRKRSASG